MNTGNWEQRLTEPNEPPFDVSEPAYFSRYVQVRLDQANCETRTKRLVIKLRADRSLGELLAEAHFRLDRGLVFVAKAVTPRANQASRVDEERGRHAWQSAAEADYTPPR